MKWRLQITTAVLAVLALLFFFTNSAQAAPNKAPLQVRPGTAASPFGWATAVADLDSDEKLDFAVADRGAPGLLGYDYRLELGLSREPNQIFHFHSVHSALTVSILDLDNDRDLDVVLSQSVSGEVAEVWINNGHGQFHRGNAAGFAGLQIHSTNRVTVDPGATDALFASLPLRKFASLAITPVRFRGPPVSTTSFVRSFQQNLSRLLPPRVSAPRAPPLFVLA